MTQHPPPAPAPHRARSALRWAWRIGLVLLQALIFVVLGLLALVGGWVQSADFEERAIALAEAWIEDQTGEDCDIDELDIRFWPPAVETRGFHLYNAENGDIIARVDRARAPLVLRDGRVGLGRVIVERPFLWLHLDDNGKLVELRRRRLPDPGAPRQPLQRLPWSSLQITDGTFRLTHPQGQSEITDLDLTPIQGSLTDLSADLHVRVRDLDEAAHLSIEGIELGPEVIVLPPFSFESRPLILTGEGRIPVQGAMDLLLQLHVPLEELNPVLSPPRQIHGEVYADLRLEGPPADPTVRLTALTERLGLDLPGVFTPLLTYEIGDASASVVASKDEVLLENLTVHLASGTLEAWGRIDPASRRLVESRVVGSGVILREMLMAFDAAPTPWVTMSTDLEVGWEGSLDPLHLEGHFDIDVAGLRVGNRPIADPDVSLMLDIPAAWAKGTIVLEKDHLFLAAPTVVGPRTRGSCTIDIGFGPRGPLDLHADLHHVDLADFQPLNGVGMTGRGRITGRIWGPFNALQLEGTGDLRDFSVMEIPYADQLSATIRSPDMKSIELIGARARKGQTPYHGRFAFDFKPPMAMDVDIAFDEGRIEDAVGIFIDLPGMTGKLSGTVDIGGPLYQMDGSSHLVLEDIDLWGERFDRGEAHGYMDGGLFTLNDLRVERDGGRAGLVLRGSVERDWALNMELYGDGLTLEGMTRLAPYELPVSGNIALHTHIGNTLFDPSPDGRIALTDVRYDGFPIDDSHLVFESTDGVAHFGAVLVGGAAEANGTLGLWDLQPYDLTIAMHDFPVHLFYPVGANGQPVRATTSGTVAISGHFGTSWSPVDLDARLDAVELSYLDHRLRNRAPWRYTQHGKRWQITDFGLVGGDTDFTLSASGGDSLLLGGEGTVDLELLRAVVPGLQKARGVAEVELYARGTPPRVEAAVDVSVQADLLRHSSVPASFENLRAQLTLTDSRIELTDLRGYIGGGTIQASGAIEADGWIPTRYDLSTQVRDAQIQWVDTLPPAIGDADLVFDGPVDAALLSGQVTITDMPFTDRIDWEDWVIEYRDEMLVDPSTVYESAEDPWFALDIGIQADHSIRLRNNVADGRASASLRIIGDTNRPGLVGQVRIDEGFAYLQDRDFVIQRGDILFNDPWSWDPDLDFDLQTDITNLDQRYRVNYLVYGPFSDWRTETRSDPQLPQADVNALLWFGVTTEQLEESGELGGAVAQGVADLVITDFLLSSGQGGEIGGAQELLPVDRVDLATGVNARGEYSSEPRLVVGLGLLDEAADLDITWEQNLVRPDDIYVSIERPFAGNWSLSAWYATQQRDRVLPIGGAYGADITWRGESD